MDEAFYIDRLKDQLWSFTEAMAEAIDARTPYNATHIRMVANYAEQVADRINELHKCGLEEEYFDTARKEQLVMSALLHDVGKIVTPTHIMNKGSRLQGKLPAIRERFKLIQAYLQIDMLKGHISESEYKSEYDELENLYRALEEYDEQSYSGEETRLLKDNFDRVITTENGDIELLTPEEKECLVIEKGTLSERERAVMEQHVKLTQHILSRIRFIDELKDVPVFAGLHHEMCDGSGYPNHLTRQDLPLEARILSACDVCDALLAADRPYKSPMHPTEAFSILEEMAAEGKLDRKIVGYLKDCIGNQK